MAFEIYIVKSSSLSHLEQPHYIIGPGLPTSTASRYSSCQRHWSNDSRKVPGHFRCGPSLAATMVWSTMSSLGKWWLDTFGFPQPCLYGLKHIFFSCRISKL